MVRYARYAYLASLLLFLAGLVFQVYLVGQSLFVDPRDWSVHREFGWAVAAVLLLILLSALFSRLGRWRWAALAVLLLSAAFQPYLATFRFDNPSLAALHPLNAVLLLVLTLWLLQDAWHLIRSARPAAPTAPTA